MAGLFLMTDTTFNSLAVGSILVVAIAVLGSITVLPALLAKLGRWVDRPRVPLLWRLNRRIGQGGISRRLLGPVLRHPVAALLLGGAIVAALAVPALGMKTHAGNLDTLPGDIAEVQTIKDVIEEFPSEGPIARVVVRAAGRRPGRGRGAARRPGPGSGRRAGCSGEPTRPVEVSADGRTSILELAMPFDESDEQVDDALRLLRDDLVPASVDLPGSDVAVGGDPAESLDAQDRMSDRLPLVIGFVLLLTFLMMVFAFKSVPIAADLDRCSTSRRWRWRSG